MKEARQLIDVNSLPSGEFEGYYWYSNSERPEIIKNESIQSGWFTKMPFIVEANFYSRKNNTSIHVKHIDGEYKITQVNLAEIPDNLKTDQEFIAHDLNEIKKYHNVQIWRENVDELLEDMITLTPAYQVFAGFIN